MTDIEGQHPLLDVPAPVEDQRGFRGPIAVSAAAISYRQLDYWARTGLVEPALRGAHGSGSQRLYSFRDVLALSLVQRLLDTGVSLANIRTALGTLRAHGTSDLASITPLADGVTVYECTTDQQVIDLVRGGQGVFGIAIGQVWTDVQATLTHLPTETPPRWGSRPVARCFASSVDLILTGQGAPGVTMASVGEDQRSSLACHGWSSCGPRASPNAAEESVPRAAGHGTSPAAPGRGRGGTSGS